ncbi:MAG: 6-carboxytetrahydropterin synthase [Chitinophagales bacterium]|jgi:6-pyruvoyltetrahydropterin/6-carboxytetrahydropterin synthase|nr:6-carboxytetrahydropterin synthase [Chitinophagales bacterium]
MRISIFRKEQFNAAHRLYRKDWDDQKNSEIFGLCSNPLYHGHNYNLEVKITGEVDPETGYLLDLKFLKEIIRKEVLEKFDHKNLNEDTEEFRNLNPTAENIAFIIHEIIRKRLDMKYDIVIRLYETERNFVEYPA